MGKCSEVYDVMWDTYGEAIDDKDVKEFNILILGAEQYGVEEEMIAFSKAIRAPPCRNCGHILIL